MFSQELRSFLSLVTANRLVRVALSKLAESHDFGALYQYGLAGTIRSNRIRVEEAIRPLERMLSNPDNLTVATLAMLLPRILEALKATSGAIHRAEDGMSASTQSPSDSVVNPFSDLPNQEVPISKASRPNLQRTSVWAPGEVWNREAPTFESHYLNEPVVASVPDGVIPPGQSPCSEKKPQVEVEWKIITMDPHNPTNISSRCVFIPEGSVPPATPGKSSYVSRTGVVRIAQPLTCKYLFGSGGRKNGKSLAARIFESMGMEPMKSDDEY